jgi:hypothetical protein
MRGDENSGSIVEKMDTRHVPNNHCHLNCYWCEVSREDPKKQNGEKRVDLSAYVKAFHKNELLSGARTETCCAPSAVSAVTPVTNGGRDMRIVPKRRRRRVLLVAAAVGAACFVIGLALAFVVRNLVVVVVNSSDRPHSDIAQRPPSVVGDVFRTRGLSEDSAAVLSNVYLTVKTTKRYHYPRLVILLETWVSLVKAQVS